MPRHLFEKGNTLQKGSKHNVTHGMSHTPIYGVWNTMLRRCLNLSSPAYSRYGGRGIGVCARWLVFEHFYADMGDRPPGKSLDRKNNDGDYEPGNCRWATPKEQSLNSRRTKMLTFNGTTLCIADWSKQMGLPADRVYQRINKLKWSPERALGLT